LIRRLPWPALLLISLTLLGLTLLGACALPINTAVRDWSRTAGVAVVQPPPATSPASDAAPAIRQALSTYFYAIGVVWDGADLSFDEAEFRRLASRAGDPVAAQAILDLGQVLKAASDEKPPRWLQRDNTTATPAYEDQRFSRMIPAADDAVQALLAILSEPVAPGEAAPPFPMAGPGDDPALMQIASERQARQARDAMDRAAARSWYAEVMARIGEGHALLAARADRPGQRSTERQLHLAEDHLRRAMAGSFPPQRRVLSEAAP
jgi:hypothetical protein